MTTRTNPLTRARRVGAPRAGESAVWSLPKVMLVSICPNCNRERFQHGYTRHGLLELLKTRRKIDAYCIDCNVCWSISESERRAISPE